MKFLPVHGNEMELSLIDLLLYGRVLGVIATFRNSVIFLMILNKWHSLNCTHLLLVLLTDHRHVHQCVGFQIKCKKLGRGH